MKQPRVCLLIDDDSDDHEIFALAMADANLFIDCYFAASGPAALEKLRSPNDFVPDFIFLDLNMPGMDGLQCLEAIKSLDHLRHIPVIIYTTSSEQKDLKKTKALGAAGFITKPSDIADLVKTLTEFFRRQD